MNRDDLSLLIRELLVEELAAFRGDAQSGTKVREEFVSMRTDADVAKFARHVMDLAKDPRAMADIQAGRHVFRLASAPTTITPQTSSPVENLINSFDKGLISEKEIMALPVGHSLLRVGKNVCLTPLARDVMRQRGIKLERTKK